MALSTEMVSEGQLHVFARAIRAGQAPLVSKEVAARVREALKNDRLRLLLGLPASNPNSRARSLAPGDGQSRRPTLVLDRKRAPRARVALHHNPFYVLDATLRDNRQRIVSLAEDASLMGDSTESEKARADLTNPRTRLTAEMAWLPGLSPNQAAELIRLLDEDPDVLWRQDRVPPLARANLLAAALEVPAPPIAPAGLAERLVSFGSAIESVKLTDVLRDLNEDRGIARFPELKGPELLEPEMTERMRCYQAAAKQALDRLETTDLLAIITSAVDLATHRGTTHGPQFIDDLADMYAIEATRFFEKVRENVEALVADARSAAPKGEEAIRPVLESLSAALATWERIARPIQTSMRSRGLTHDPSARIAYAVRSLGVDLANEHGLLDAAKHITDLLQQNFGKIDEVAERLGQDASAIEDLLQQRDAASRQSEAWAKEIAYSVELGLVFKDTLAISKNGVRWKNTLIPLRQITRVRWGGVRHSVNYIPTGTTYTICFGNRTRLETVALNRQDVYQKFTDKLWRAVGVPMMLDILAGLKDGKRYRFGDALVDDSGVELTRHRFMGSDQRVRGDWSQLQIWNADGAFVIGLKGDDKTYASASYIEDDNVHLLEAAVRMSFKHGHSRLSELLTPTD